MAHNQLTFDLASVELWFGLCLIGVRYSTLEDAVGRNNICAIQYDQLLL